MDDQSPANDAAVEPQGRLALASFRNNIVNVIPAQYVWVKNFSNFLLGHKASETAAPPRRALFWIIGDLEKVSLAMAGPYSSWFVDIRLPPATNKALSAIVKTGPYKTYTPPNPYSLVRKHFQAPTMPRRKKATAKHVLPSSPLPARQQTPDATTKRLLGYQLTDKEPSYSLGMQGIYHLGTVVGDTPATPGKRKGGCLLSPRRQRGAPFVSDPSRPS
ncbi:hypothetical protein V8E54_006244 [Elaphomyces granulatus]